MSDLGAAHRGYEYQDLLVACRLVDVLLESTVEVHIDEKLVDDDRFDDLTTMDLDGRRQRTQFKHTDGETSPLDLGTFTSDQRSLRLDCLVAAAASDRTRYGSRASTTSFRLVVRDGPPDDRALRAVLRPASPDPGPFLPGMNTTRLRFDAAALWQGFVLPAAGRRPEGDVFAFLREGSSCVNREDLAWLCEHLVIEVDAPPMSRDLRSPGPAEGILLRRVGEELGAGVFPNEDRSIIDVAEALLRAARIGRQGGLEVTFEELLRCTRLRQDFGAVARAHPVDHSLEVNRHSALNDLLTSLTPALRVGGARIAQGPPGQGKSWLCQQLVDRLTDDGWLVAEHYCFLGDADGDKLPRVMAESVFGSLLSRLAEADPGAVNEQRPRFAADETALVRAVERALRNDSDRPILLVVDGIDHVTRVHGGRAGTPSDPSLALAEILAGLHLPQGSALLILSQPGKHLAPFTDSDTDVIDVPALEHEELRELAARLGVIDLGQEDEANAGLLSDGRDVYAFLEALYERSEGNALYATYICREVLARPTTATDAAEAIRSLPALDGNLESYYAHLYQALGGDGTWVADTIALLDMPVTADDLCEIIPEWSHRVGAALELLAPVLQQDLAGVRVYHESFARFLRRPFQQDLEALTSQLDRIADWLTSKGFFDDPRAFRSLTRVLADAGRDSRVLDLLDHDFVVRSVASGYQASLIRNNLAIGVRSAARLHDWPAIGRFVELSRAADAYQEERFDSTVVRFADVPVALLGRQAVANRLLQDGRPVMPARAGVQMCAALDASGAAAPWGEYLPAFFREDEIDNTLYGRVSDLEVQVAVLRGRLRLAANASDDRPDDRDADDVWDTPPDRLAGIEKDGGLDRPVPVARIVEWLDAQEDDAPLSLLVECLLDTHGWRAVLAVAARSADPGPLLLQLAEAVAGRGDLTGAGTAEEWARRALRHQLPAGSVNRLLALGLDPDEISSTDVSTNRELLLNLTKRLLEPDARLNPARIAEWLDLATMAAHRDPMALSTAEALIEEDGWYRWWLRFCLALAGAAATEMPSRSAAVLEAVDLLARESNPFAGEPRACDLYPIQHLIKDSIRRAVALLDDNHWASAFEILRRVSDSINTTLFGEMGGPVPPDFLLTLAIQSAENESRRRTAEAMIQDELTAGGGGRFYSDLAEYHLLAARLAIASNDSEQARDSWHEACRFLTAYGWHKDITIYELLDPLPLLIRAAPRQGRTRLADVQPLCDRVVMHTDRRETRGAPPRWWRLLAQADPTALSQLASSALISECNDPNSVLHGARYDLWRTWQADADPVTAMALRLTLESPLDSLDPELLGAVEESCGPARDEYVTQLECWFLARADERPDSYPYSNSHELVAKDDGRVGTLNEVAGQAGLPRISPMPRSSGPGARQSPSSRDWLGNQTPNPPQRSADVITTFPPGIPGLNRALRVWQDRPYGDTGITWAPERFANVIGYRLLSLLDENRVEEVSAVLASVAGRHDRGDSISLLRMLAEGLDRRGAPSLAAQAYALTWTRTRGHGGWLTFGGKTSLDGLRHANDLDPEAACTVVATEIEHAVSRGGYRLMGITQALIIAFAHNALTHEGVDSTASAFAIWDEAFAVISSRAPRVHPSDDPELPYRPPREDPGTAVLGDLDRALARAAVAGIAHPGREQKRRAFLALQALLVLRPETAADAVKTALKSLSDPATLGWLLCVIERTDRGHEVARVAVEELTELAKSSYLSVRVLARRLLPSDQADITPLGSSDGRLLQESVRRLWSPANEPMNLDAHEEFVTHVLGDRLAAAENQLPGISDAVLARAVMEFESYEFQSRLHAQLGAYADQLRNRWPDAFLATEETVEVVLQLVAAGGRGAQVMAGIPVQDPAEFENRLAETILNDPGSSLALEETRWPRPQLPPPPPPGDPMWGNIPARDGPHTAAGTVRIGPAAESTRLTGGALDGWCLAAAVERRFTRPSDYRREDALAMRFMALELRSDDSGLDAPPMAEGDVRIWQRQVPPHLTLPRLVGTRPLMALDNELRGVANCAVRGLGVPPTVLAPTPALVALLNLQPGSEFVLEDDSGPAMSLLTWRTLYSQSDYHLTHPKIVGCGVALRPDLLECLAEEVETSLTIRDYIFGDTTFGDSPATA